jgi:AraC-like DNA-binding protein/lambda repressor-like predicted transcriptional regulator
VNVTKGKLVVVSSAACGFLVGAGMFAFNAFANTGSSSPSTASSSTPAAQANNNDGDHDFHFQRFVIKKSLPSLATYLHVTPQELHKDLANGQSLDDIAKAHNISEANLQTELKSLVHSALEQPVIDKRITEAQESTIEARIDARLPQIAADKHLLQHGRVFETRVHFLQLVAKDLHMTVPQLVSKLKSGQSINSIAQAQGVSPNTLKDELHSVIDAKVNGKIDKILSKSHWFTQDEEDTTAPATITTTSN